MSHVALKALKLCHLVAELFLCCSDVEGRCIQSLIQHLFQNDPRLFSGSLQAGKFNVPVSVILAESYPLNEVIC